MPKKDKDRDSWVRETQMFQRIAQIPETPTEELQRQWEADQAAKKHRNSRRP